MIKLVVNRDHGEQELLVIHESGNYHDKAKVVWDERVDGKLSAQNESSVGGLVRAQNGTLSVDAAKLATARAAKQSRDAVEAERFAAPTALRLAVQGVDFNQPLQAQKIAEILKHVVRLLT